MSFKKTVKALGLSSGGLDSILSALVLQKQGIEVEWISMETPFFSSVNAKMAGKANEIPVIVKDITDEYLVMLKSPKAGYGKNMNPCMDCHALMFNIAGRVMEKKGFDFLFSGEVVGQRPMSQNKNSLRYVERHSGFAGKILRPLSAKLLPETSFEKEGLVDRQQLLNISGRSRKIQMALAKKLGVKEFPAPAGGCRLTDIGFSGRLRDLFKYEKYYSKNDLFLLHHGRHLRLNKDIKIIVGRDQRDNENILKYYDADSNVLIKMPDTPGPVVLVTGKKIISLFDSKVVNSKVVDFKLTDFHSFDIQLLDGVKELDGTLLDSILFDTQLNMINYIKIAIPICTGYSKLPEGATADVQITTPWGGGITKGVGGSVEQFKKFLLHN
ncbi:MAG: hypothetical protein B6I31_01335 [Desulfobacteraceae bacterium 4572_19]|nr:MAG: hypothetical protein B6I31_01335 [Desulfobacteraceae bacterium 4572_19]